MTVSGPDFLCIGQQKAATTWLYDQLQFHPDFWMPPVKELHYLSKLFPHRKTLAELSRVEGPPNKVLKWQRRRNEMNLRTLQERDFDFFRLVRSLQSEPHTLDRYAELFRFKGTQLTGDISPSYATLDPEMIADVAAQFPALKVILHVRDPVARAWSDVNKRHRAGQFDAALLQNPDAFLNFISVPAFSARAFGTKIARKWMEHIPPDRFLIILFDDIAANPAEILDSALAFLATQRASTRLEAGFDRKSNHSKLSLPEPIKAALVEYFAEELVACADLFAGAATGWPARYGLS